MKLKDFLLHKTKVADIVVIREGGWQIGMTMIDNEDLFIHSLNPTLLELYTVTCYTYDKREWANKDVLVVDIKRIQGDDSK